MEKYVETDVCEERKKWVNKRLDNHEERLETLEKTYQTLNKMNYQIEQIDKNVSFLNKQIREEQLKPNKRYDAIVMQIISFVIEAILVIVAVRIGLK